MRPLIVEVILIFLLAVTLTGCAPKIAPVAYQCPSLKLPDKPVGFLCKLTVKSPPDQVAKCYDASLTQCLSWQNNVFDEVQGLAS